MPKKLLLLPEDMVAFLERRFANQCGAWLAGEGSWPLRISLGPPSEKEVFADVGGVRQWVSAWADWKRGGEVLREERSWDRVGVQRLPVALELASPQDVAKVIGSRRRWDVAAERYLALRTAWPVLTPDVLRRKFELLADYPAEDFERLGSVLAWVSENRRSGLYLRQLPVHGLDTKWIEKRMGALKELVRAIVGAPADADFYEMCGLRISPYRIRLRILGLRLREAFGGLSDIESPLEEFARLAIRPASVIIVENLATGLALPVMDDTVAIMKLGTAVPLLAHIGWLKAAKIVYWGDIDTHGLAILSQARAVLPQLTSVLMDRETLLAHRPLWVQEPEQYGGAGLEHLSPAERALFDELRSQALGHCVRLEQERLPWSVALATLREAFEASESPGRMDVPRF